jgi:hypothetical protein
VFRNINAGGFTRTASPIDLGIGKQSISKFAIQSMKHYNESKIVVLNTTCVTSSGTSSGPRR